MADFNRQDEIPKSGPKWWIQRLRAGEEGLYTIFSRSVWGVWTHYGLYGSIPCLGDKHACYGCQNRMPKRWKGYYHAYDHHHKRQCFVEVTPRIAEAVVDQLGLGQPIRGYRLKMKRGRGDKSRVKVEVLAPLAGGPELVDEKNPEETLRKLWDLNRPDEDGDNALSV